MDRISGLSDECLVKILSFLPTKVAVSSSVLSKRWECLWMWLPKLEYNNMKYSQSECVRLRCFLHRSLPLHKAPVLETLRLTDSHSKPEDIKFWVVVAASRCLRKLEISYFCHLKNPTSILPSNLYNSKSLVNLKIVGDILLEVPRNVCLPSLKTLQLFQVAYPNEKSLQRLLSICPLLKDLLVCFSDACRKAKLIVFVPSLQRLTLIIPYQSDGVELVINTPSLEYFKLNDEDDKSHYYMIENKPKLVEAYVDVVFPADVKSLIGSITSVKRLTICLETRDLEVVLGENFIFNQLEHLKLCLCTELSANLLIRMLKISPNLRILELFTIEDHKKGYITCRIKPTMAPECVLSSLQIFNWSLYSGTPEERDFAVYILKTACCLKIVRISSEENDEQSEFSKHEMLKDLTLSSRASTTCQLVFK